MAHKSAHREMQDAVQDGYNRGVKDTVDGVLAWLEDRAKDNPDFEAVRIAFRSDWVGIEEGAGE